jgi:hypothetical protein
MLIWTTLMPTQPSSSIRYQELFPLGLTALPKAGRRLKRKITTHYEWLMTSTTQLRIRRCTVHSVMNLLQPICKQWASSFALESNVQSEPSPLTTLPGIDLHLHLLRRKPQYSLYPRCLLGQFSEGVHDAPSSQLHSPSLVSLLTMHLFLQQLKHYVFSTTTFYPHRTIYEFQRLDSKLIATR